MREKPLTEFLLLFSFLHECLCSLSLSLCEQQSVREDVGARFGVIYKNDHLVSSKKYSIDSKENERRERNKIIRSRTSFYTTK